MWRREFDALAVAREQMAKIRDWWKEHWPLPVGRLAFRREQRSYKGYRSEAILPVLASLPFDGGEEALLALRLEVAGGALLELFALAVRGDEAPGAYSFYWGQLAYRLSGKNAIASDAPALIASAQAWLARFNGRRATQRVGRRRLTDRPDHPWRLFADQAIEMRRGEPFLTRSELVEHLGLLSEGGQDRRKTLGRWITWRLEELAGKEPS